MNPTPRKHGHSWSLRDYQTLVYFIRTQRTLEQTAKALDRSVGSVDSRVRIFDDSQAPEPSDWRGQLDKGLANLQSESYDWHSRVIAYCAAHGLTLWDDMKDGELSDWWNRGITDPEVLANFVGSNENQTARRLKDLGLIVKKRRKAAATPVSLVLVDASGRVRWTSAHGNQDEAAETLIGLLPEPETVLDFGSYWRWTIALTPKGWTEAVLSSGAFIPAAATTMSPQELSLQPAPSKLPSLASSPDLPADFSCPRCIDQQRFNVPLYRIRSLTGEHATDQTRCVFGHIVYIFAGREVEARWRPGQRLPTPAQKIASDLGSTEDELDDLDDWEEDENENAWSDARTESELVNAERIGFWDRYSTDDETIDPSEYSDPGYWVSEDDD
ncbi:hypothetical protein [Gordonia alkaliphila]|uniref:Uncharacterized protein n=1 Tax=Gordonia alkaliphila TaxID=1053547 RepID=A0ABP8ZJ05_9ACTN